MLGSVRIRNEIGVMLVAGVTLILSGWFHLIIWSSDGSVWTGPLSWRKPILFGISSGVTLLSLAWAKVYLRSWRWDSVWFSIVSIALLVEVAAITLQTWRGVPSHFNRNTLFDEFIHLTMDVCITIVVLGIFDAFIRSLFSMDGSALLRLSFRAGLVLLCLSCVIGYVISVVGYDQLAQQQPPETCGEAGVLKFPHGIPMHAVQFFPIVVVVMQYFRWPLGTQRTVIHLLISGTFAVTLFSLLQTFSGLARFEFSETVSPFILLVTCITFLLALITLRYSSGTLERPSIVRGDS